MLRTIKIQNYYFFILPFYPQTMFVTKAKTMSAYPLIRTIILQKQLQQ